MGILGDKKQLHKQALLSCLALYLAISALPLSAQENGEDFGKMLSDAGIERTFDDVVYNPNYYAIPYPNGDVPANIGVCTDVVIRAYRALGIDLQKDVHEDMQANFLQYPKNWGLTRTDTNIDHRRVPNLQKFFTRHGQSLEITQDNADYLPGDLVTWNLNPNGRLDHIGIVTDRLSPEGTPLISHNIGSGPELSDILFRFEITGHYRYSGSNPTQ